MHTNEELDFWTLTLLLDGVKGGQKSSILSFENRKTYFLARQWHIYPESFTDTKWLGEYILFANPPICLIFDDTLYKTNKAD